MLLIRSLSRFAAALVLVLGGTASLASADIMDTLARSYMTYYYKPAAATLARLPDKCADCPEQAPSERSENPQCRSFYNKVAGDGIVRTHVAFGYFDDSGDVPANYWGTDLGYNSSLDQAFYRAFVQALTGKCTGRMQACEFRQLSPGFFAKNVRTPEGRTVRFEIQTEDSSLTPYYLTNTVDRAEEQRAKSQAARRAFLNAVKSDEVVFYVGHSRNGGGPDFFPPKILANRHVDYSGYYKRKKPGFVDLLNAVRERGEAPPLLVMYSCLSEARFGAGLHKLSPHTSYIFSQSDKLSPMNEYYTATIATLDGLMRFQCYQGVADSIRSVREDNRVEQHLRNFMSDRHPVNTRAKVTIEGT